jgi:hypothetical protein
MADAPRERKRVTFEEVLVSAVATNDALAKLLIAKGIITEEEFNAKLKTDGRAIWIW